MSFNSKQPKKIVRRRRRRKKNVFLKGKPSFEFNCSIPYEWHDMLIGVSNSMKVYKKKPPTLQDLTRLALYTTFFKDVNGPISLDKLKPFDFLPSSINKTLKKFK